MPTRIQDYQSPTDWQSAQNLLNSKDLRAVPLFLSPRPQAPEDWPADVIVDLSKLRLNYIKEERKAIRIGVLTSLQTVVESELLKERFNDVVSFCAELAGTMSLRNYANIGGLLKDSSAPQELLLAFMALDAEVIVRTLKGSDQSIPVADFLAGKVALQPGEVPFEVAIPSSVSGKLALERVARTPRDFAIVAAVARLNLKNGVVEEARVAISGASPASRRLEQVEKLLKGQAVTPENLEKAAASACSDASPVGDLRGSAEYRKSMAGVVVRRAVMAAAQQA